MYKYGIKISIFIILFNFGFSQEVIIQENEIGFCFVDGIIESTVPGYEGTGYANPDAGVGVSMAWNVIAESADTYHLRWRYALGGNPGDRPARLLINGVEAIETINFAHTTDWDNWVLTDSVAVNFDAGSNNIRIEAYSESGLANYDYLCVLGEGITASECNNFYTLSIDQNFEEGGTVSYQPLKEYYEDGTVITLEADANSGYFFQSWTGDETSAEATYNFSITKNTNITAIFLPEGTFVDTSLIGYATLQDDKGTPYMTIGGTLGSEIEVESYEDLQTYLNSDEPYIVYISKKIIGSENIKVSSNKTLFGVGDSAHLQGIGLELGDARNVIIKDLKISHVTPQDAIEINNSRNVWIDHCDLFSDREHGEDYYDGLLDIKNESSFITVSWTQFHDHFKTVLISSGDTQFADTTIRVTFHHNYFYNCESRLPSIRFGKAHVFNNYYKNCGTAINSRMGACVRVERNFFNQVGTAVMMEYSTEKGSVALIDNRFGTSGYSTTPACTLNVPYEYASQLDETLDIPLLIAGDIVSIEEPIKQPLTFSLINYPNPFNPKTVIQYTVGNNPKLHLQKVDLTVYSIIGQKVATLVSKEQISGTYQITWDASVLPAGLYICRLKVGKIYRSNKMILLK
jgi:pectate lyase